MGPPTVPKCLHTSTISGQPSCVAFSPLHRDLFAIGTYQLDEDAAEEDSHKQSRSGNVQLFRLLDDGNIELLQKHDLNSALQLNATAVRSPGAVLDLRFCPWNSHQDVLAVSTSTGLIIILRLLSETEIETDGRDSPVLELLNTLPLFDEDILVTSLSWNPVLGRRQDDLRHDIAVTLSDGHVAILSIDIPHEQGSKVAIQWIEAVHEESAWVVQWNISTLESSNSTRPPASILTGGDDASIHQIMPLKHSSGTEESNKDEEKALHEIDLQSAKFAHQPASHILDSRTHSAGVTSISLLPRAQEYLNTEMITTSKQQQQERQYTHTNKDTSQAPLENAILTGSYDNTLRILRIPSTSTSTSLNPSAPRRWKTLSSLDLSGGVWKIDILSSRCYQTASTTAQTGSTAEGPSSTTHPDPDSRQKKWLVLASCMHAGVRIVEVCWKTGGNSGGDTWTMEILASFQEGHDSMCYASAGQRRQAVVVDSGGSGNGIKEGGGGGDAPEVFRVVSTSFYDRKVCVWDFEWGFE